MSHPNAAILDVGASESLVHDMKAIHGIEFPLGLSLLADGQGLELWADAKAAPIAAWAWNRVVEIAPASVKDGQRLSNGLLITVADEPSRVTLISTGAGFMGLATLDDAALRQAVAELESRRG